jgi:hypothetical protein
MLKKISLCLCLVASLVIAGCSAIQPEVSGARKVLVAHRAPAKNCKYLDQVVGNQGNFFTGSWTSNANLEEGALNDMRNKAAAMGGNYIELLANRAGVTGGSSFHAGSGGGGSSQTNVVYTGNVFRCPNR